MALLSGIDSVLCGTGSALCGTDSTLCGSGSTGGTLGIGLHVVAH